MPEIDSIPKTFLQRAVIFFRRLCGYGVLFFLLVVVLMIMLPYLFPHEKIWIPSYDRRAQMIDSFSLAITDPVQYWSSRADYHQSLPVHSERMDTLLVEWFEEGQEWVCIAMKENKPMLYYGHSFTMRRLFVNEFSVYTPIMDADEGMASPQLRTRTTTMESLERLAGKIGQQTIRDLLTIGRVYYENRGPDDNHKARELMFNALRMAYVWNKQHPEAKIDLSDIPTTITERLKR